MFLWLQLGGRFDSSPPHSRDSGGSSEAQLRLLLAVCVSFTLRSESSALKVNLNLGKVGSHGGGGEDASAFLPDHPGKC